MRSRPQCRLRQDTRTIYPQEVRAPREPQQRSLVDAEATADYSSDAICLFTRCPRPTRSPRADTPTPACLPGGWPISHWAGAPANRVFIIANRYTRLQCKPFPLPSNSPSLFHQNASCRGPHALDISQGGPRAQAPPAQSRTRPDRAPLGTMALSPASWKPRGRRAQCPLPAAPGPLRSPAVHRARGPRGTPPMPEPHRCRTRAVLTSAPGSASTVGSARGGPPSPLDMEPRGERVQTQNATSV